MNVHALLAAMRLGVERTALRLVRRARKIVTPRCDEAGGRRRRHRPANPCEEHGLSGVSPCAPSRHAAKVDRLRYGQATGIGIFGADDFTPWIALA
jgi:hypothetical protein